MIAFALAFAMLLPVAMRFRNNANSVAVGGNFDSEAFFLESIGKEFRSARFVFDEEDSFDHGCGGAEREGKTAWNFHFRD